MRRVKCRSCGVMVEEVIWGDGLSQLTRAYIWLGRERTVKSFQGLFTSRSLEGHEPTLKKVARMLWAHGGLPPDYFKVEEHFPSAA